MTSEIASHLCLPDSMLTFHPERSSDQNRHPLRGLLDYGPYSSGFVPDPIRVATVAPRADSDELYTFMKELNKTFQPKERKDYVSVWPGFQRAFNLRMSAAGGACHVNINPQLDEELQESAQPHVTLAEHLIRAIQSLEARRTDFDIVFIYIPARWERGFEGPSGDDFDLHDHLKAYTAARSMPIQLARLRLRPTSMCC